ncbi:putative membrane protein [Nesterenkonia jeotgali]|uniref:Putative membrane protein n=2 Tax=Nesterenkonia jeotgali TaxID=317018 RepID=A0A839FGI3_9MICC|nr:putative membrane protein [Nesterenkonia jeotgali]
MSTDSSAPMARRIVLSGVLFGCGIAASMIDLFIFHLALQWHHFYDVSTTEVALTADGFFHAFGWFITIWGLFLLADVRRRTAVPWTRWTGAVLTGVGFFQLLDGVLSHKVLGIHQIRYGVDLFLYDLTWIGSAVALLLIGLLILRRTRPTQVPA